jgi:hypothetical protein
MEGFTSHDSMTTGTGVEVGGAEVLVGGAEVLVGGAEVLVGGAEVLVGGTRVLVAGADVEVGGLGVFVGGLDVAVGERVGRKVFVGMKGVSVPVGVRLGIWDTVMEGVKDGLGVSVGRGV